LKKIQIKTLLLVGEDIEQTKRVYKSTKSVQKKNVISEKELFHLANKIEFQD
jgi:hypothetical protein